MSSNFCSLMVSALSSTHNADITTYCLPSRCAGSCSPRCFSWAEPESYWVQRWFSVSWRQNTDVRQVFTFYKCRSEFYHVHTHLCGFFFFIMFADTPECPETQMSSVCQTGSDRHLQSDSNQRPFANREQYCRRPPGGPGGFRFTVRELQL